MSWKRWTLGLLIAVAVLIVAGFYAYDGITDMWDRLMGR